MAEIAKRKQTLTKTMATNVKAMLASNKDKKPAELAELFRKQHNPSHWPTFKLEKIFKGLVDGTLEIVETFDRGPKAKSAKTPAPAKKQAKVKAKSHKHVKEMSTKTLPVTLFHPAIALVQKMCRANNAILEISPDGIRMAEMPPEARA